MLAIGHKQQKNILNTAFRQDNLPHAFIFSGLPRIGKKTVALEFVQSIFCQSKTLQGDSCGECYACRAIRESVFPDLAVIAPEESGKEIKLEQIEQLIERLSLKSYNNYYKVGIIDEAHLMNIHAQNALLKTLEEPKGKTVLILITAYPERLLPTIRSRAQALKFSAVPKEEIEKHLVNLGASQAQAKEITLLSSGQIGRAVEFLNQPERIKDLKQYIEEIENLCQADYAERFRYAKQLTEDAENQEEFLQIMEIWERFFRREMLYKIFGHKNRLPKYTAENLFVIVRNLEKTKYLIATTNINKKLALENFLLNL